MKEKLLELLVRINNIIDVSYDEKAKSIGVLDGVSGIALFKMQYGHFIEDEKIIDDACEMLDTCVNRINQDYFYPAFCSGIAGFSWTMSFLYRNNLIDFEIDDMLLQLDTYLYKNMCRDFSNDHYDFLHGGMGYAIYFLERYKNTKYNATRKQFEKAILEVIDILKIKVSEILDCNSIASKKKNLGLSHGITSILAFLNKLAKEKCFKYHVEGIIKDLAFHINMLRNPKQNTLSFFPNLLEANKNIDYNSRLAWCYGDLGIAYTLLETAFILDFQNNSLKETALHILLHTVKRKKREETFVDCPYICHGSFGNAHIYSSLFHITNINEFKDSAYFWLDDGVKKFEELLKKEDISLFNNKLGIIDGVSGIGLVIMSFLKPQDKSWNRIFLLS